MFEYSDQIYTKVTVSRSAATYNTSPSLAPPTTAVLAGAGRRRRRVLHWTIHLYTCYKSPLININRRACQLSADVQPGVAGPRLTALHRIVS